MKKLKFDLDREQRILRQRIQDLSSQVGGGLHDDEICRERNLSEYPATKLNTNGKDPSSKVFKLF